jgi:hypothetical protein
MIKEKSFIAAIFIFILPLSPAQATRTQGRLSVGAFVSAGLPLGPDHFKNIWNPGIGFGAVAVYPISRMDAVSVGFAFQTFCLDSRKYLEDIGPILGTTWEIIGGGSIQTSLISADYVRYLTPPESALGFYLTAGGGYYLKHPKDVEIEATIVYPGEPKIRSTVKADTAENKLGLHGGAGFELSVLPRMGFVIETKYHVFFTRTKNTSFLTVMGGIRFSL